MMKPTSKARAMKRPAAAPKTICPPPPKASKGCKGQPSKSKLCADPEGNPEACLQAMLLALRPRSSDSMVVTAIKTNLQALIVNHKTLANNLLAKINMGTACTGTGMPEAIHALTHNIFNMKGEVEFACEIIGFKRLFYEEVVAPHVGGRKCMYSDLKTMAAGNGECTSHPHDCIPQVGITDIFVCGFSCKDLSTLSTRFKKHQLQNVLKEVMGTTGTTFGDMCRLVRLMKPRALILENVNGLAAADEDGSASNMEFLYDMLESFGYVVGHRCFQCLEYGLPQRRACTFLKVQ